METTRSSRPIPRGSSEALPCTTSPCPGHAGRRNAAVRHIAAATLAATVLIACSDGTQPRVPSSVQVSQTSVRMEDGESVTVTASLLDQNGSAFASPVEGFAISWSSSAPAIASVNQGVITGETPGQAIVTAKAGSLPGANINVQVDATSVADIQLYVETNLLRVGATLQLYAYLFGSNGHVLSGRSVTWTSLTPELATVSPTGVLTGHLPGWAIITVSSEGRSDAVGFHIRPPLCTGSPVGTLVRPDTVSGALEPTDCDVPFEGPWPIAAFGDAWRLDLDAAATVRIDLMSDDFDAVLYLSDLELNLIDYDDDGGVGYNSRITRQLAAGSYLVWASSFYANEVGEYRLVAR
jgi:hypothetical protein